MLSSGVSLHHVVAVVAAACTGSFLLMDCDPSLYDRYLQVTSFPGNEDKAQQHRQHLPRELQVQQQ
jgi:hypothetical protein